MNILSTVSNFAGLERQKGDRSSKKKKTGKDSESKKRLGWVHHYSTLAETLYYLIKLYEYEYFMDILFKVQK